MSWKQGDAILATDVRKSFGKHEVLGGVAARIAFGSMVAVVGENGAGKSTLLRILSGTLAPDGGFVQVSGRIGFCPQTPVLSDNLTVEQHLVYFAAAYGLPSTARADELVNSLSYESYRRRPASELSGGTRQKLNLTIALMHDPDVLLLDEPYQGFDWETYLRFWSLVGDLRSRGTAIVVISHLVFDEDRFDAVYELHDGKIRRHDPADAQTPDGR